MESEEPKLPAVRSIAWLDALGKAFSRIDRYGMPLLLIRKISAPLNHSSKGKPKSKRICITVVLVFEVARLSIRRGKSKPTGMSEIARHQVMKGGRIVAVVLSELLDSRDNPGRRIVAGLFIRRGVWN
jgi:hypothetical protein